MTSSLVTQEAFSYHAYPPSLDDVPVRGIEKRRRRLAGEMSLPRRIGAVAALLFGSLALDSNVAAPLVYEPHTEVVFTESAEAPQRDITIIGGARAGHLSDEHLTRAMSDLGSTRAIRWPETGFNTKESYDVWKASVEKNGRDKERHAIASSMGVATLVDFLGYYEKDGRPFGKNMFETLILDSPLLQRDCVIGGPPLKDAKKAYEATRDSGFVIGPGLSTLALSLQNTSATYPSGPLVGVTKREMRATVDDINDTPLPATLAQGNYIANMPNRAFPAKGLARYVTVVTDARDWLLSSDCIETSAKKTFPSGLRIVKLDDGVHAPLSSTSPGLAVSIFKENIFLASLPK